MAIGLRCPPLCCSLSVQLKKRVRGTSPVLAVPSFSWPWLGPAVSIAGDPRHAPYAHGYQKLAYRKNCSCLGRRSRNRRPAVWLCRWGPLPLYHGSPRVSGRPPPNSVRSDLEVVWWPGEQQPSTQPLGRVTLFHRHTSEFFCPCVGNRFQRKTHHYLEGKSRGPCRSSALLAPGVGEGEICVNRHASVRGPTLTSATPSNPPTTPAAPGCSWPKRRPPTSRPTSRRRSARPASPRQTAESSGVG